MAELKQQGALSRMLNAAWIRPFLFLVFIIVAWDLAIRLFKILERRLAEKEYLADEYSIADMPTYASTVGQMPNVRKKLGAKLGPTPGIDRWIAAVGARPAVARGMRVPS